MKQNILVLIALTMAVLLLAGRSEKKTEQTTTPIQGAQQQEQPAQAAQNQTFSTEEIAKHNSKESCWLLISGKVYDVTKNIGVHPGGTAILQGCGKDATTLFETRPMGSGTPHSEKAQQYLEKTYIGNLQE